MNFVCCLHIVSVRLFGSKQTFLGREIFRKGILHGENFPWAGKFPKMNL